MKIDLPYQPPFDWPGMLAFFRSRAIPGVEMADLDVYRRTIAIIQAVGGIAVRHAAKGPALQPSVSPSCRREIAAIVPRIRRMFDLDTDMAAVCRAMGKDPLLKKMMERQPGLRLPGAWDPFETAVRAVVGQQVSVKAARTVIGRIVARAGKKISAVKRLHEATGLTHFFPTPQEISECDLDRVGMPRRRIETISALAQAVLLEQLSFSDNNGLDNFVQQMIRIPGIGDWTAQYTAMRALGDPDAFPASDLGIVKALSQGDKRPTPKQVLQRAENWRPWRAYAAIYLWHSN